MYAFVEIVVKETQVKEEAEVVRGQYGFLLKSHFPILHLRRKASHDRAV